MTTIDVRSICFELLRASNLPKSLSLIGSSGYFARITTGTGWHEDTDIKKGDSPKWNKTFICEVNDKDPNISIEVFRLRKVSDSAPELVARASVDVTSCLTSPSEKIFERHCELLSPKSTRMKKAHIYFSCTLGHDSIPTLNQNLDPTALLNMIKEGKGSSKLATPAVAGSIAGVVSFSSSSADAAQNIMEVLRKIEVVGDAIAKVHPYAKIVWNILSAVQKVVVTQMTRDDKIRDLWGTVSEALDLSLQAEVLKDEPMYKMKVEELLQQIYECVLFLRWYEDKDFNTRMVRDSLSAKSEDAITLFNNAFRNLSKSFQNRLSLDQVKKTYRLVTLTQRIADIAQDQRLDELPGAKLSSVEYDPDRACMPGTRTKLLDDIYAWVHSLDDNKNDHILWISGPAGTGKSSVANTVAANMDSLGRLAASFRFDRNDADRTPDVLIGNICRQVARFNSSLQDSMVAAVLRYGPGRAMACAPQARKLLVDPVRSVELVGPIVIVIDALDESGRDDDSVGGINRVDLVRAITKDLVDLPPSVKLLVTSREEGCITRLMSECTSCKHVRITEAESTEEDIKRYIERRMDQIRRTWERPVSWPGEKPIQALVRYADGLFICAAVACSFIEESQPDWRLKTVLDSSRRTESQAEIKLDALYRIVFQQGIRGSDSEIAFCKLVLGAIVALKTPLTASTIDALLGLPTEQTSGDVASSLKPVMIDMVMKKEVQLLHKSVFDFLTVRAEEGLRVDVPTHSGRLAVQCLMYMNQNLFYNMKWMSATFGPHSPPNLDGAFGKTAPCDPLALYYACFHFAEHFAESHLRLCNQKLAADKWGLDTFLTKHLLHWFEFMARLGKMHVVEVSLRTLISWLERIGLSSHLHHLHHTVGGSSKPNSWLSIISDATGFLQTFRVMATLSPMDIYHSALPMSPHTSMLYKLYHKSIPYLPVVMSSHPLWTRSLQVFEGHHGSVTSVVFSSDGKKLASGSWDNSVRLWDAERGEAIGPALRGHTKWVTSVMFSSDGKKLASGSWDNTVRLWDVEKREVIGSALKGHTDRVTSVMFSSDGKKLASGSWDNTIRLWDAEKGEPIGPALEGHTNRVTSVVFSSDGMKLASGSWDNTVRLWDVGEGEAIGVALKGHTDWVTSVVFSNDGKKLASGSSDNTVQLWDSEKGQAIGPALEGHTKGVTSVVFSSNGKKLASGSWDNTVWLWDAEKGKAIGVALKGHTNWVTSVIFSNDGKKLASGSSDNTVRLWDAEKGEAIGVALKGHTDRVTSVVFSNDGKQLASGSWDSTVRLWDVEGGEAIGPAFEGHTNRVTSVVFSGDGKKLASGSWDKTVRLWDAEKGKAIGPVLKGHTNGVTSVVFSGDGKRLASRSSDNTVRLWDVEKGEAIGLALKGHTNWVTSVMFSDDGKKLASRSWDNTVQLWDAEKGEAIGPALIGHTKGVTSVVFSSDGKKLATGSWDNTVRLWDAEKGQAIGTALKGHTKGVTSVVFSGDGRKLASGSSDKTVQLWDVEKEEAFGTALHGHTNAVTLVVFSSDGKKLASRSIDGVVWVWDVEKREGNKVNVLGDVDIIFANYHDSQLFAPHITNNLAEIGISRAFVPNFLFLLKSDESGFIINGNGSQLIWVPAHLRGNYIAIHKPKCSIAIGGSSGPVTIIRDLKWPHDI